MIYETLHGSSVANIRLKYDFKLWFLPVYPCVYALQIYGARVSQRQKQFIFHLCIHLSLG